LDCLAYHRFRMAQGEELNMKPKKPKIPGNVFPRKLNSPLPVAVKAEGPWIEAADGKRYLDASGGAVVTNLGHGRKDIAKAVFDQITTYDYIHPTMFTTPVVEELAETLAKHTPKGLDRFYFLSGGGEAIEAAIKLARQIHIDRGEPERFRLIARWKSYHGMSMGALSAMGRTAFRVPFAPLLNDAVHIPPPYCYRCSYGLKFPDCKLQCALALEETILNLGKETVSAFLAETVSGATLACYPPPAGYWQTIREICDKYGVLLILDEVMCGMGRTGRWFACQEENIIPDLMTLGKGLSGGVIALSAVAVRSEHFETIRQGKEGTFVHGGTFTHHPVAAAAGLATVRIIEEHNLIERVSALGKQLGVLLKNTVGDHPNVGDIRGRGFLWGIELVRDKATKAPFKRQERTAERIWETIFNDGVIVYKSSGLAGTDGDALVIAPPFTIEKEELDIAIEGIKKGITKILG